MMALLHEALTAIGWVAFVIAGVMALSALLGLGERACRFLVNRYGTREDYPHENLDRGQ